MKTIIETILKSQHISKGKSTETETHGSQNIQNESEISKKEKIISYCKVCKEPNGKEVFEEMFNRWYEFHVYCKCDKEAEFKRKFNNLLTNSLFEERYKNVDFENSKTGKNPSFDHAFNRCKKYCQIHEKVLKEGLGIYLFGPSGIGKTHITACIAKELMKNLEPVFFTNLFEISKAIKSTFNKNSKQTEQKLIEQFSSVKFLFFDDLGSEIFTKNQEDTWINGLLFDLINKRYNAKLPTIFSSNYSLNELINHRQISQRTVSRIVEMTSGAVMKIEGEDLRNSKNTKDLGF